MATTTKTSHWSTTTQQMRFNHTDHWSKLKSKSYYHTQTPTGNYVCYCRPQYYGAQGQRYKRRPFEIPTVNLCTNPHSSRHHVTGSTGSHVDGNRGSKSSRNTLALIGNPELSQQLSEIGTLQLPTPQQWLTGIRGEDKGKRVSSASSFRAKQGFKYWPQDAVKPSVRTMGAKGTFLGIEMPRL